MFEEGIILYFDPFYFKNGNPPKSKYFVVLKKVGSNVILASLPSSKDFVPSSWHKASVCHCIEIQDANFNCFYFLGGFPITDDGWYFPENTYLYGNQIDEYSIDLLNDIYPIEGLDYEVKGKISNGLYKEILDCFRSSSSVKRKFKKLL